MYFKQCQQLIERIEENHEAKAHSPQPGEVVQSRIVLRVGRWDVCSYVQQVVRGPGHGVAA